MIKDALDEARMEAATGSPHGCGEAAKSLRQDGTKAEGQDLKQPKRKKRTFQISFQSMSTQKQR